MSDNFLIPYYFGGAMALIALIAFIWAQRSVQKHGHA